MRRFAGAAVAALTALCCAAGITSASAAARSSGWSKAIQAPGTAALNQGGAADIEAVSCASAGNCSAAGTYRDESQDTELYVLTERHGRWGTAEEIPGTATLNAGGSNGNASIAGIACKRAGNCVLAGNYDEANGFTRPFVDAQRGGTWGIARELPGANQLTAQSAFTTVSSLSCSSAGNCALGGSFIDQATFASQHPFVALETRGHWRPARRVPGIGVLTAAKLGRVTTVACWSRGNCQAAGEYQTTTAGGQIAFTVTASHGRWGSAHQLPGYAALNAGPGAAGTGISSLACQSAGNCSAAGSYQDAAGHLQVFVASERHGVWGNAAEIRGSGALNTGGAAFVNQVSCGSAGNCSAGGLYAPSVSERQAFVVSERHWVWGKAEEVPGLGALNTGNAAAVVRLSCGSPGNCSAGGAFTRRATVNPPGEAFVVTEHDGIWGKAEEVPGTAKLNSGGDAAVFAMSCNRGGQCAAGGQYEAGQQRFEAFVISRR